MCFYGGEQPVVWDETHPRAARAYACEECDDGIAVGDRYQRIASLYDSRWSTFRTCLRCEVDRKRVRDLEVAAGCSEHEAWCPVGDLHQELLDRGLERTPRESVAA